MRERALTNLKSEIIRIAFNHPEMRKHLLPLIAASSDKLPTSGWKAGRHGIYTHPDVGDTLQIWIDVSYDTGKGRLRTPEKTRHVAKMYRNPKDTNKMEVLWEIKAIGESKRQEWMSKVKDRMKKDFGIDY